MTGGVPDWLGKPAAVFMIDAMLAGDNALVVGLVCHALPPANRRLVLLLGSAGAVFMRVMLAGIAGSVLACPGLRLAGGLLLALLALNLANPLREQAPQTGALDPRGEVLAAILTVVLCDVLMSLDNVLALAAIAGDNLVYLGLGLALSVSLVMFGSAYVTKAMERLPGLARLGAALLGYVAGQMVMSDTLIAGWTAAQAPALPLAVPVLTATYVYVLAAAPPLAAGASAVPAPAPVRTPRSARTTSGPADPERLVLIAFVAMTVFAGLFLGVFAFISSGTPGD